MAVLRGAKCLDFFVKRFDFEKSNRQEKQGFVFEGGSGAAKTWDIIQGLIYYCEVNRGKNKDILIFRQQFADLRKTVLKDFIKILQKYEIYEDKNYRRSQPTSYELFGNIIYFSGLDSMGSHGERHDIIWGNEAIEIDFEAFKQLNMRCNECYILDYNPSVTEHWIYDNILKRPDCHFLKVTMMDNPFLPRGQREELLSFIVNDENIARGTADDFMEKVYVRGLRGICKGLVFKHITYVDSAPNGLPEYYGLDFGFTNDPTALVKISFNWDLMHVYLELLLYEPIDHSSLLIDYFEQIGIEEDFVITADTADGYEDQKMVADLRNCDYDVRKVYKGKGKRYMISTLKRFKIHIVKNHLYHHAKKEAENYKYREINGKIMNEPIDGFDHFWDATLYGLQGALLEEGFDE